MGGITIAWMVNKPLPNKQFLSLAIFQKENVPRFQACKNLVFVFQFHRLKIYAKYVKYTALYGKYICMFKNTSMK